MTEGNCHCGAVRWSFDGVPADATACNCTLCRRYGALWAYGFDGEAIRVLGPTSSYARNDGVIDFHFCATCGCVTHYRMKSLEDDGRRRIAVNLRLADPDAVGTVIVDHFDGLATFDDLGRDGRRVKDMWF